MHERFGVGGISGFMDITFSFKIFLVSGRKGKEQFRTSVELEKNICRSFLLFKITGLHE